MSERQNIETISSQQLKEAVESYITWASDWDGALPADVFFGAWTDMKADKQPLEIRARVAETGLEFSSPAEKAGELFTLAPQMTYTFRVSLTAEGQPPDEETLQRLNKVLAAIRPEWKFT